jgi:hypothetical protein
LKTISTVDLTANKRAVVMSQVPHRIKSTYPQQWVSLDGTKEQRPSTWLYYAVVVSNSHWQLLSCPPSGNLSQSRAPRVAFQCNCYQSPISRAQSLF